MYNYFMLIGTVCKDVEMKELADGKRVVSLVLATSKPFPGPDGTRGTDFFNISLWEFLADQANETLKQGSRVAIKGRILPKLVTLESGARIYVNELIGERLMDIYPRYEAPENLEQANIEPKEEE